ncbi:MAG: oligoribonuclease [Candidatus Lightella neohaematopini]|nr:oligoribonuclease [Candidatus Lightella neohaematopini]MCV2528770.1 oligoribonuclease [Candidatus Lightella neohaematopini]
MNNNLIWLDLEMTGLNPDNHRIIEIATLVTDINLNILAEGPSLALYQPEEQLLQMDNWNIRTHTATGLLDRVRNSKINEIIAEEQTITFLTKWVPIKKSPICGNSIAQDRRFLFRYMPKLESYFNYKYLDVSTIKELVRRWKPQILSGIKKRNMHQALADIRESVAELNFYRKNFFSID